MANLHLFPPTKPDDVTSIEAGYLPETVEVTGQPSILKIRQMTTTHISELPNEILVEIFTELRNNNLIESWYKITFVCRHWRAVALEDAILWTRPPTAHHEYTLLMLERSRQCPLEITLHQRTPKDTSIAVLNHIGRISTLTIIEQSNKALDAFQTNLLDMGHKALQLRSLQIQDKSWPPFKLSATTFLESTSLKSVQLSWIDFDWQIFPIPSLASLSLESLRTLRGGPSWAQFLGALRDMPLLEDLLFGFDDLHLKFPPILPESLQMPCLRRLEIKSGHPTVIQGFLLSTMFPQMQEVYVTCSSPNDDFLNDYSAAINASLSLITRGDFGRLDHAKFDSNRFMMSQLPPVPWKSRRTLEFSCPHTPYGRPVVLDAMAGISALPGDRASDFVLVACRTRLPSEFFTDLFGRLPRLESLRAPICSEVIDSLRIPPLESLDVPILFLRLRKITLDGNVSYRPYSSLVEELSSNLMARRKYGSGVKELCLNLELTKEQAEMLQAVVADLDFWGTRAPCLGGWDE
ncbi:hypothetical protein D9619_010573 [Psilocybe cf. subviscida]|uniref:F-box domain-containing protein n=1 Tax=Psilocybe cf. subviscida TaxID=2480587 RepID=A0A8H5AT74_9AGAR|nr:hypothetical protein D9619_010573 [Psilocybe cf. subviscida]